MLSPQILLFSPNYFLLIYVCMCLHFIYAFLRLRDGKLRESLDLVSGALLCPRYLVGAP